MHAIVMVHKMQRMALSSHQLLGPAASGAEKADSENTRNSENNVDDPPGKEEEDHQASIQRDSSQPTDEAAGSEQQ